MAKVRVVESKRSSNSNWIKLQTPNPSSDSISASSPDTPRSYARGLQLLWYGKGQIQSKFFFVTSYLVIFQVSDQWVAFYTPVLWKFVLRLHQWTLQLSCALHKIMVHQERKQALSQRWVSTVSTPVSAFSRLNLSTPTDSDPISTPAHQQWQE